MGYAYDRQDLFDLVQIMGMETKVKGDEIFFKFCPYCHGDGRDKNTFSVKIGDGRYNCFRASCGAKGHFVEMARDFNYRLDFKNNSTSRSYRTLPQKKIDTTNKAIEYLSKRGISEPVVKAYKITTQKDNDSILVFPFFDDENKMQFVKYRNANHNGTGNKEWCEKDTKPILFGMAQCSGFDRLIITEGQIDSLSIAECGITNAVSVPTGAMGFTWVEHVWEWINKFKEVIVFGDCEKGKITLIDTLSKRLECPVKCVQEGYYLGEKDANAILLKYGKDQIKEAIDNARIPPLKNVKDLADVESVDIYNLPRIYTGITEIDKLVGGLFFGQVVVLTGKRGDGKSTFMSQTIIEAVEQNYSVFAYSGELVDYHFKRWIDLQCAGKKNLMETVDKFGESTFFVPKETQKFINDWYRGRIYLYDNNYIQDDELDSLVKTIEQTIRRYGVKYICIDNLMTALDVGMGDDIYKAQSKFVKDLKTIATKYNVVIVLVAHPRKTSRKIENDDISGSADITNRVDLVLSYSRNDDELIDCDSILSVKKNRLTGKITGKNDGVKMFYNPESKRITTIISRNKKYSWEQKWMLESNKSDEIIGDLEF